ncbi:MAG: RHS repeat protein [Phycisphaerae bacterium]|nr:RHS repeat protein [Phycisphaerae bacterium]
MVRAVREFQWDYRNRLISVTDRDSAGGAAVQVVEFTYDAMGNRIAMVVDADGDGAAAGQATYFVYDGDHIILEYTDCACRKTHPGREIGKTGLMKRKNLAAKLEANRWIGWKNDGNCLFFWIGTDGVGGLVEAVEKLKIK